MKVATNRRNLVGDYVRALRARRGVSQAQLAAASQDTTVPIDRGFIATLETRGLPGTCKKLLALIQMIEADPRVLYDMSALNSEGKGMAAPGGYAANRDQIIKLAESGHLEQALLLAADVLQDARTRRDRSDQALSLMSLAIVTKNLQRPHAARHYVEEALKLGALEAEQLALATILLAITMTGAGLPSMAVPILESVDPKLRARVPEIGLEADVALAVARFGCGDDEGVIQLVPAVKRRRRVKGKAPTLQRGFAVGARAAVELGRRESAYDWLALAQSYSSEHTDPDATHYLLAAKASLEHAFGSSIRAVELWLDLERHGRASGLRYAMYEARLNLCSIALTQGDVIGARKSIESINVLRESVVPDPRDAKVHDELTSRL